MLILNFTVLCKLFDIEETKILRDNIWNMDIKSDRYTDWLSQNLQ